MIFKIIRFLLDILFYRILGLKVEGGENIPKEGAIIVAPNHKSYWDPPLVGVASRERIIHYMAKEELFKNPIFGWVLRKFGTFPVKRGSVDRQAIKTAVMELKKGNPLGIFPEGTRIKKEGLGRFHSGMASLALMTGTPVLPVAIVGSLTLPKKNGPLAVLIGKPIPVEKGRATDEKVEELNGIVKSKIEELMDEYKKRNKV